MSAQHRALPCSAPDVLDEVEGTCKTAIHSSEARLALRRVASQGQDVANAHRLGLQEETRSGMAGWVTAWNQALVDLHWAQIHEKRDQKMGAGHASGSTPLLARTQRAAGPMCTNHTFSRLSCSFSIDMLVQVRCIMVFMPICR